MFFFPLKFSLTVCLFKSFFDALSDRIIPEEKIKKHGTWWGPSFLNVNCPQAFCLCPIYTPRLERSSKNDSCELSDKVQNMHLNRVEKQEKLQCACSV